MSPQGALVVLASPHAARSCAIAALRSARAAASASSLPPALLAVVAAACSPNCRFTAWFGRPPSAISTSCCWPGDGSAVPAAVSSLPAVAARRRRSASGTVRMKTPRLLGRTGSGGMAAHMPSLPLGWPSEAAAAAAAATAAGRVGMATVPAASGRGAIARGAARAVVSGTNMRAAPRIGESTAAGGAGDPSASDASERRRAALLLRCVRPLLLARAAPSSNTPLPTPPLLPPPPQRAARGGASLSVLLGVAAIGNGCVGATATATAAAGSVIHASSTAAGGEPAAGVGTAGRTCPVRLLEGMCGLPPGGRAGGCAWRRCWSKTWHRALASLLPRPMLPLPALVVPLRPWAPAPPPPRVRGGRAPSRVGDCAGGTLSGPGSAGSCSCARGFREGVHAATWLLPPDAGLPFEAAAGTRRGDGDDDG